MKHEAAEERKPIPATKAVAALDIWNDAGLPSAVARLHIHATAVATTASHVLLPDETSRTPATVPAAVPAAVPVAEAFIHTSISPVSH